MSWCRMLVKTVCVTLYPIMVISHLDSEVNKMRFYLHFTICYVCHRLNCTFFWFLLYYLDISVLNGQPPLAETCVLIDEATIGSAFGLQE